MTPTSQKSATSRGELWSNHRTLASSATFWSKSPDLSEKSCSPRSLKNSRETPPASWPSSPLKLTLICRWRSAGAAFWRASMVSSRRCSRRTCSMKNICEGSMLSMPPGPGWTWPIMAACRSSCKFRCCCNCCRKRFSRCNTRRTKAGGSRSRWTMKLCRRSSWGLSVRTSAALGILLCAFCMKRANSTSGGTTSSARASSWKSLGGTGGPKAAAARPKEAPAAAADSGRAAAPPAPAPGTPSDAVFESPRESVRVKLGSGADRCAGSCERSCLWYAWFAKARRSRTSRPFQTALPMNRDCAALRMAALQKRRTLRTRTERSTGTISSMTMSTRTLRPSPGSEAIRFASCSMSAQACGEVSASATSGKSSSVGRPRSWSRCLSGGGASAQAPGSPPQRRRPCAAASRSCASSCWSTWPVAQSSSRVRCSPAASTRGRRRPGKQKDAFSNEGLASTVPRARLSSARPLAAASGPSLNPSMRPSSMGTSSPANLAERHTPGQAMGRNVASSRCAPVSGAAASLTVRSLLSRLRQPPDRVRGSSPSEPSASCSWLSASSSSVTMAAGAVKGLDPPT
mmetsp:Transcript_1617/g.4835  ORF Transcript_1617/g.4835 Transcript_1617/m.4835 type:complete len:573 (+) Transcript_1617:848-2566(+)